MMFFGDLNGCDIYDSMVVSGSFCTNVLMGGLWLF